MEQYCKGSHEIAHAVRTVTGGHTVKCPHCNAYCTAYQHGGIITPAVFRIDRHMAAR